MLIVEFCKSSAVILGMSIQKKILILITCTGLMLLSAGYKSSNDRFAKLSTLAKLVNIIYSNYVEDVDMDSVLEGAIVGMLEELDPHSTYIPKKEFEGVREQFAGEFEGIGIEFDILDGYITVISPIPGTPSERAGLQSGDKIVKIDGESAYNIEQKDVVKKLRGPKNSSVDVTIKRMGQKDLLEVTLVRAKIPLVSVLASFMIDESTGYIKINRFASNTAIEVEEALIELESQDMDQLIIDFRNNGGGLLGQAVQIVDLFVNTRDTIVFTQGRIPGSNEVHFSNKQNSDRKYPVIAIINRGSASASEIVTGALQDLDRGLIIGETSFGKGLVQRQYELPDESAARITIARYYTPSGRLIQREFENVEDYYRDLRNKNRELNDSTIADRPLYYTRKGRKVYGGGGITPDIFIQDTTKYSKSTIKLLTSPERYLFNYGSLLKENIGSRYEDYDTFERYFIFGESDRQDLFNWLLNSEFEFEEEHLNNDIDIIENRLLAEIAGALWGKEFSYHKRLQLDKQILIALENIDEAWKILN
jgi:carboxyl-terminal processing protease